MNESVTPRILSASTITGDKVCNAAGEQLGDVKEIMLDVRHGRIAYAVLSFGGFLGLGEKLFAIPWSALTLDSDKHELIFDVDKDLLERAEGFDKDDWPDFADVAWNTGVHEHWGQPVYWR